MTDMLSLFPESYETSRQRFRNNLSHVQEIWPNAQWMAHPHQESEDLTTDWFQAEALEQTDKVFILTTGEHGIEGFVGSAMLQLFIERFLVQLDPKTTGILLVHAINPWGMKHHRRTNANNVDLNRNFVWTPQLLDPNFNPGHLKIDSFVNPKRPVGIYGWSKFSFSVCLTRYLLILGFHEFKRLALLGQYYNPTGVHFGGNVYQEETQIIRKLYREAFQKYGQILHLDMHTGYGPRYQMSLVNSGYQKGNSQEFSERFNYPLVVAANTDEFYELRGDMIDYVYTLWQNEFPEKRLYSNSFEFGTYGDSIPAVLRTIRAMSLENQAFCFGARSLKVRAQIESDFLELFYPQADDWRIKAVADADQAFDGILRAEGFIP